MKMDNSNNEMEYNSKILNFMAMTETGDPEIATKYLQASNWDETDAVNQFFSKIKVNNNIRDEPNLNNNILNSNLINNEHSNQQNDEENEGFLSRYILGPIKALLGVCKEKREVEREEEERIFHLFPNKIYDSRRFCHTIKRKIGIIIFYSVNNVQFLNRLINQMSRNTMLMNLLRQNFCVYPLLANTNEGYRMQNVITDNQMIYPSFVFCFNRSNYQRGDYLEYIFDRNHIISILEGDSITLDIFNNTLLDCIEKLGINYNDGNNNLGAMTDGEVLEQQKADMENLERQAQRREEEQRKQKLLEEQKRKEEELKKKEIENKVKKAREKIVSEPEPDDPNATTICFRYPDGEKRKDRRFLKTHTIQNLYDYVTSLGREIYTEEENNAFSLFQPFPPKKYDEMQNTLEKEGLFPNAIIQIREE